MISAANLLEPRNSRFARWAVAAVLISVLHVGGSYAMLHWQEEMAEESSGAIVVEIAPTATALALETVELPPGQLAEEAAPSQASSEPVVDKVEEEAPKEDLVSPAPDPEVTLQKPTEVTEKPKEEPKEDPRPKVEATQDQVAAAKTTAPARIDAALAEKAAAPDVGTSTADRRSVVTWQNSVVLHLNRHKRYPNDAKRDGRQGDVHVRFKMDRAGQLIVSELVRGSGSSELDKEAIEMLKRASPLPRPPVAVQGETLELIVPIRFRIK